MTELEFWDALVVLMNSLPVNGLVIAPIQAYDDEPLEAFEQRAKAHYAARMGVLRATGIKTGLT